MSATKAPQGSYEWQGRMNLSFVEKMGGKNRSDGILKGIHKSNKLQLLVRVRGRRLAKWQVTLCCPPRSVWVTANNEARQWWWIITASPDPGQGSRRIANRGQSSHKTCLKMTWLARLNYLWNNHTVEVFQVWSPSFWGSSSGRGAFTPSWFCGDCKIKKPFCTIPRMPTCTNVFNCCIYFVVASFIIGS